MSAQAADDHRRWEPEFLPPMPDEHQHEGDARRAPRRTRPEYLQLMRNEPAAPLNEETRRKPQPTQAAPPAQTRAETRNGRSPVPPLKGRGHSFLGVPGKVWLRAAWWGIGPFTLLLSIAVLAKIARVAARGVVGGVKMAARGAEKRDARERASADREQERARVRQEREQAREPRPGRDAIAQNRKTDDTRYRTDAQKQYNEYLIRQAVPPDLQSARRLLHEQQRSLAAMQATPEQRLAQAQRTREAWSRYSLEWTRARARSGPAGPEQARRLRSTHDSFVRERELSNLMAQNTPKAVVKVKAREVAWSWERVQRLKAEHVARLAAQDLQQAQREGRQLEIQRVDRQANAARVPVHRQPGAPKTSHMRPQLGNAAQPVSSTALNGARHVTPKVPNGPTPQQRSSPGQAIA